MMNVFTEVSRMLVECQAGVLVTVIDKTNCGPAEPGTKLLVRADGKLIGTIGGGELELQAIEKCQEIIKSRKHLLQSYNLSGKSHEARCQDLNMICGGTVTLFYEYIPISPMLFIFGAGHIGRSLCRYSADLNYQTNLIDDHAQLDSDFNTNYIAADNWENTIRILPGLEDNYMVICTSSHDTDFAVLKAVYECGRHPRYIGLVASSVKARAMADRLRREISPVPSLAALYSPAGLNIGGKTPGDIAVSIIAEIQSLRFQKYGNPHMTEQLNFSASNSHCVQQGL